jgi:hypothetical protein
LAIQIFLHRRWRRFYVACHSEARASGPFCPCHARTPHGWSSLLALEGQSSSCAYTTIRSRILNLGPHLCACFKRRGRDAAGVRALTTAAHTGRRGATPELSQAMSVTAAGVAVAPYYLCYSDRFCVASFDQGKVGYERTTILCADRGRRA